MEKLITQEIYMFYHALKSKSMAYNYIPNKI